MGSEWKRMKNVLLIIFMCLRHWIEYNLLLKLVSLVFTFKKMWLLGNTIVAPGHILRLREGSVKRADWPL